MSAKDFLRIFIENKVLLASLILINLGGTAFGAYYYWDQLAAVSPYFLPFVPDSPTATLLFAGALFLILIRRESGFLNNFAFIGLVKVGLWTLFTMAVYNHHFFAPAQFWYYGILFVLHAGMIIEALVLRDRLNFNPSHWIPVIVFYLLGDFLDYFMSTVPTPLPVDRPDLLVFLAIESFAVTVGLAYWFNKKWKTLSR